MFLEAPPTMDKFTNGINAGNMDSMTFFGRKINRKSNKHLHGIELPPLYPWAPDIPKHPPAPRSTSSSSFNGLSTGSSTGSELPAESEFLPTTPTGPGTNGDILIPEKYFSSSPQNESNKRSPIVVSPPVRNHTLISPHTSNTQNSKLQYTNSSTSTATHGYGVQTRPKVAPLYGSKKRFVEVGVQTDECGSSCSPKGAPMLTLCGEMIAMTLERLKHSSSEGNEQSLLDGILASSESVKGAVFSILEAYSQAQEAEESIANFAESELIRMTSMQLVAALELLVSQASLWVSSYSGTELTLLQDVNQRIHQTVKDLASQLLAFIQGCECGTDSVAEDLSSNILSLLYQLMKYCGELALATDTCPTLLRDPERESLEELISLTKREDDLVHSQPSQDMKQAFLGGVDVFLDKSLEGSLRAVEGLEEHAQDMMPGGLAADYPQEGIDAVLQHVCIVVCTSKILVLKCRQAQVELNAEMKDDAPRADNYHHRYYRRCRGLVSHTSILSDSLSLLVQVAEPLTREPDPGALRKVGRCAEMVQRASQKLLLASSGTAPELTDFDMRSTGSDASVNKSVISSLNRLSLDLGSLRSQSSVSTVLSSGQNEELESAGEHIREATNVLVDLARQELTLYGGQEIKVKRMLPATPSNSQGKVRCRSARSAGRRRLSHNLSLADTSFNND